MPASSPDDRGSDYCSRLVGSESLRRYRTLLRESLAERTDRAESDRPPDRAVGNRPVASEFAAWRQFVSDRHGDVFARLAEETERASEAHARDLFVDTLSFDFLLVSILAAAERRFDCSLIRPLSANAAIPFDPDFAAVHESVTTRIDSLPTFSIRRYSAPTPATQDDSSPAERPRERTEEPPTPIEARADRFVDEAVPGDVAALHRECVSPSFRRAFGRYDTPGGLAALAAESAIENPSADADDGVPLIVDPGCGAGAFLAAAAERLAFDPDFDGPRSLADDSRSLADDSRPPVDGSRPPVDNHSRSPAERLRDVFEAVRGFDVSPTAVRASRLALVLAVRPLLEEVRDARNVRTPSEAARERPSTRERPSFTPRVVLGDAVEANPTDPPLDGRRADALLANPPWLTWDSLPERAKDRWRTGSIADERAEPSADDALDLFGHSGRDARLGYANDDLSVPYAWTCLHRLLGDGGRAALVLKRDLLTGPAGERLRRPSVGGRPITYDRVHDFGALSPFDGVDAGTALFALRIGRRSSIDTNPSTSDPSASDPSASDPSATDPATSESQAPFPSSDGIPTTRWTARSDTDANANAGSDTNANGESNFTDAAPVDVDSADSRPSAFESLRTMRATFERTETRIVAADPVEPTPEEPWIPADAERRALGDGAYRIRHGVKDDAKAVYAVDRETVERRGLEPDHVYPYLKSKHVVKYGLFGHDLHLVPQRRAGDDNEAELRSETPATYAYLDEHRERLLDRGSSWFEDGPFYSLFGLGPYTWADYKVVWCRLGFKPHFAVVSTVSDPLVGEKPVVPGDHCMFVGTDVADEAHYLCALLNSAPYQRCLRDVSSGGKSSLSKSTVDRLALPEWRGTDRQRRLADLSERAHDIVPEHVDCSKRAYNRKTIPELAAVQTQIDRAAERFLRDDVDPAAERGASATAADRADE